MESSDFLRSVKQDAAEYKYLPTALFEYLENVIKHNVKEELLPALSGPDRKGVFQRINEMFKLACLTSNMSLNEFVTNLDIDPNDTIYGRLDASFAIVRVINRLRIWGFSNIRPLKAGKTKRADLYCEFSGMRCVAEVFCSLGRYFRYPDHEIKSKNLAEYYLDRVRVKRAQLDRTVAELSCEKEFFALVFNSLEAQATLKHEDFLDILKRISSILSWGPKYHFLIMTGMQDLFTGISDDVIFPPMNMEVSK